MELLQKSKENSKIDTTLHNTTAASQDALDYNINNIEPANFDLDTKETPSSLQQEFTIETLISAYHSIAIS